MTLSRCTTLGFTTLFLACAGDPTFTGVSVSSATQDEPLSAVLTVRGVPTHVRYVRQGESCITQGDILLPCPDGSGAGRLRQGLNAEHASDAWPDKRIPYVLAPNLVRPERVLAAMAEWEKQTAFRFVARTTESDYVLVQDNPGCSAFVGRLGGQQVLNLNAACNFGSALHELGHVIGFQHEHSRRDRDEHVTVHWENVDPANWFAFDLAAVPRGPYDPMSIMHYSWDSFSLNGFPTITLKDGTAVLRHEELSPQDVRLADSLYSEPVCDPTGPIQAKYAAMGGSGSVGPCAGPELSLSDGIGRIAHFERGAILSRPAGTFLVDDLVVNTYARLGWESGVLGYPTSDREAVGRDYRYNFERGSLIFSSSTRTVAAQTQVPAGSLEIKPSQLSLRPGATSRMSAKVVSAEGQRHPAQVSWSLVGSGATIDTSGALRVSPDVAPGELTVEARSESVTAKATVRILPAQSGDVLLYPALPSLAPGSETALLVTFLDHRNAAVAAPPRFEILGGVATVSAAGILKAGSVPGFYKQSLRVTGNGIERLFDLYIARGAPSKLEVTPSVLQVKAGEALQLGSRHFAGNVLHPQETFWTALSGTATALTPSGLFSSTQPGRHRVAAFTRLIATVVTVDVLPDAIEIVQTEPDGIIGTSVSAPTASCTAVESPTKGLLVLIALGLKLRGRRRSVFTEARRARLCCDQSSDRPAPISSERPLLTKRLLPRRHR